ncbi:CoF synthetase [Microbacterium sp.]|uniref:phenylacetate--CoA ligase family protein n=1 Tax=Microbacterium sp. TaxID=51671 RepID=UPI002E2EB217|nr:CoF synthetase [Microbacterium sp.]HEX5730055.1 CoF synthetase [Microbacterium sp.]
MTAEDLAWRPVVAVTNAVERLALRHQLLSQLLLVNALEPLRWGVSRHRAAALARRARKRVPAYRDHYRQSQRDDFRASSWDRVPVTDKESFVKRHRIEDRCWGGSLPTMGVTVDESSGSTGAPTNWVRGWDERLDTKQLLQLSFSATFGREPIFAINAFVLGAWATGMIVSQSIGELCVLKSTGSDAKKILSTMTAFGPGYHYVILGYPPFLKSLVDDHDFDWDGYTVDAIYGGEAITDQMRAHLSKTFGRVIGSYGASDLEINIAYENEFTIALREAVASDEHLRRELVKDFGSLPSIFQYNPLDYYIESNERNELLFSLNRPSNIAPKIRYNIHDVGHTMRYRDAIAAIERAGRCDLIEGLRARGVRMLSLPLLFHYGRSDLSVSFFGTTVSPDGIRQALHAIPAIDRSIESFQAFNAENENDDALLVIGVELAAGHDKSAFDVFDIQSRFATELGKIDGDFATVYSTAPEDQRPEVRLYEYRTGPFRDGHTKIKHSYVAGVIEYDDIPA